jgi:hypothetical protein
MRLLSDIILALINSPDIALFIVSGIACGVLFITVLHIAKRNTAAIEEANNCVLEIEPAQQPVG